METFNHIRLWIVGQSFSLLDLQSVTQFGPQQVVELPPLVGVNLGRNTKEANPVLNQTICHYSCFLTGYQ